MNFVDVQSTVRNLIAAHPTFAPTAASNVMEDYGDKKHAVEQALDIVQGAGPGWAVTVWPPARGHSDNEVSGISGAECTIVVRLEYNPQFITNALNNLVPASAKYGAGGTYVLNGLLVDEQYLWTMNAHDTQLQNGLQLLNATGDFQSAGVSVTLVGTPMATVTAKVQIDPQSQGRLVNQMLKDLVSAVLSGAPELGGVKFGLAPDAFELVTFDEGLVAYHFRFTRFAVFGN